MGYSNGVIQLILLVILLPHYYVSAQSLRRKGSIGHNRRIRIRARPLIPQSCPDNIFCSRLAGHCNSHQTKVAQYLFRLCPCVCNKDYRIQQCCQDMGMSSMCMPLCRYKVDMQQLFILGQTCSKELSTWMYCAAQDQDHSLCCRKSGISARNFCHPICKKGKLPKACSPRDFLNLKNCSDRHLPTILKCFSNGAPPLPRWEPLHKRNLARDKCTATRTEIDRFFNELFRARRAKAKA